MTNRSRIASSTPKSPTQLQPTREDLLAEISYLKLRVRMLEEALQPFVDLYYCVCDQMQHEGLQCEVCEALTILDVEETDD